MDELDRVLALNMATEGKIKTAWISLALGAAVSAVTYLIATKVTRSTLDGVEVLLSEMYDIELKDQEE